MIVLVSGPSAVGKNFLCEYAERHGVPFITPLTTRAKRAEERDGIDYEFLSVSIFQQMIREEQLAEWDYVLGNYYGTRETQMWQAAESEDISMVHVLSRMGLRLKKRFQDRVHTVMLVPGDRDLLEHRLRDRGVSELDLPHRIAHIEEELQHAALFDARIEDADSMTGESIFEKVMESIGR